MAEAMHRRHFLGAAAAGAALGLGQNAAAQQQAATQAPSASSKLVVGVMGTGGRGTELAVAYSRLTNVEIGYVCDVDRGRAERAAGQVQQSANLPENRAPRPVTDFRRILDDRAVDILVVATCNHWHAPGAILGCAAGKHVYVEKPCSHNPREGELLVQAARRYNRKVQMGNQRRSWPKIQEAMEQLKQGVIGRVYFAHGWYLNNRPETGRCTEAEVPAGLDYALWEGPAPHRPYRTNILPYKWHWFWHWGNGELGNNGIHLIDVCRWGLEVGLPTRVASTGGRYRYDDDQETPDTNVVTFDFPGRKSIRWEGLSCNRMPKGKSLDLVFHGENGSLSIDGAGYTIYNPAGDEVRKVTSPGLDQTGIHLRNFVEGIRAGVTLNSEIEEAARSTLLCHLGNIAYRTSKTLICDPRDGRIQNDPAALQLWSREYNPMWEPKV
jgi:predicted dehydrogenase